MLTNRVRRIADLGNGDRDLALGGLDPTRAVAVAGAAGRLRPLVAGAAQERRELVLDGPLEDEPRAQATQLTEPVRFLEPIEQGGLDRGSSIWTLGAILRSTAWSPLRTSKVRFGAYAVFTFTAVSGRHRRTPPETQTSWSDDHGGEGTTGQAPRR